MRRPVIDRRSARSSLSRRPEPSLFAAPGRSATGPVGQTVTPWRTEDTPQMVVTMRHGQQGAIGDASGFTPVVYADAGPIASSSCAANRVATVRSAVVPGFRPAAFRLAS